MISSEHPEAEQLLSYSEHPESKNFYPISLHLAACGKCRKVLVAVTSLRRHAGHISSGPVETSEDLAQDMLDVMNDPDSQAAETHREKIKKSPDKLREALYFARSHAAMQQAIKTPASSSKLSSWWRLSRQIKQWLQIETAVWKLAPLTLVLVAAVMVFDDTARQSSALAGSSLVMFDDQQTIRYIDQEAQPGIGFFATRKQASIPFDGVSVEMIDDLALSFSWPIIDSAKNYQLKLQVFKNGEMVVLGRASSERPRATIKLSEPLGQYRHEWVLSGDTVDGRSFLTKGGFVVAR